jgi:zinc/manganese transport system substrate-binding protein
VITLQNAFRSAAIACALHLTPTAVLSAEPIKVVATFSVLGDMVGRIGGDHIELTTLVGPNGDAHVYKPTPAAAKALGMADVVIMNGLKFEAWLERLSAAVDFDGALVAATKGIEPLEFEEHHEADHKDEHHDEHEEAGHKDEHHDEDHEEHADKHHGHDHGEFDPHAWHSLRHAVNYVDNITAALSKADPANASIFYENRASYIAEIKALDAKIEGMMADLSDNARTVVTSHEAFEYFGHRYKLAFKAPQGLSTESEPTATDVAKMIEQIREEGISAVFVESITDNRVLQQIARETGATIGGTLYSDSLSGSDGPASTYLDMMRHNATAIASALGS